MSSSTMLPPIPGDPIDPPPKETPDRIKKLDRGTGKLSTTVGVGYRAFQRFSQNKASLLAAGTTYYLFLAMFSVIAFAYGLAAVVGADDLATYLTDAINEAFPGLLGESGLNPAQLRSIGQATSVVGLLALLYAGTGAVAAAINSVHLIYGAPPDARNLFLAKVRQLGWLALLGTLILVSYAATSITSSASAKVLDAFGVSWSGGGPALQAGAVLLTLVVNFAITYLVLSHFGGIRPPRNALLVAAGVGAAVFEVLKFLMGLIISFTVDKPQYAAIAAPIGILLVLFLQSLTLYALASLAAGIADKDVPLESIEASTVGEAQAEAAKG